MRFRTRLTLTCLALGFSLCTAPAVAQVEEDPWARNEWANKGGRFVLGVGFVYARFDTNAKFTDKQTGLSVFIDAEGSLSLPEFAAVPPGLSHQGLSPPSPLQTSRFLPHAEGIAISRRCRALTLLTCSLH